MHACCGRGCSSLVGPLPPCEPGGPYDPPSPCDPPPPVHPGDTESASTGFLGPVIPSHLTLYHSWSPLSPHQLKAVCLSSPSGFGNGPPQPLPPLPFHLHRKVLRCLRH